MTWGRGKDAQVLAEVAPFRVGLDYQSVFLLPPPFLDFLLAGDGSMDVTGFLEIHELVNVVFLREAFYGVSSVLVDAAHEVVGHADIHDFVVPVGEEVDEIVVLSRQRFLPTAVMTKQVAVMTGQVAEITRWSRGQTLVQLLDEGV
jgi:hypothetical protein